MLHPEIWRQFTERERTIGATQLDYPDWHRGRPRYWLWAIDADTAAIGRRLRRYRARLQGHLVDPYPRQAHVTVAVSGFLSATLVHNDDVAPQTVAHQEARIRALALAPFALAVGGANSFASAPFLEVADQSGALERIRAALAPDGGEFRTAPYVPHVTIGIYNGSNHVRTLRDALAPVPADAEPLALTVGAVGLYSYDATHIGSPLRLEQSVPLVAADPELEDRSDGVRSNGKP